MLRTTLMETGQWISGDSYNGRIVRVANSFVFKEPVFNYSADFPFLWDEIMVPIKYGSDYRLARRILGRVGAEVVGQYARSAERKWEGMTSRYLIEPASVHPMVTMVANQNWLEFTLRYVVDYKQRRITKDKLFVRILEQIDQTGDKVGIAASTLISRSWQRLRSASPRQCRSPRRKPEVCVFKPGQGMVRRRPQPAFFRGDGCATK